MYRDIIYLLNIDPCREDSIRCKYYTVITFLYLFSDLFSVYCISTTKSRIRNLQSIGRGLRVSDDKKDLKLFDIADDLQCENYTLNHLKERINIYNEEKFVYNIHTINLK